MVYKYSIINMLIYFHRRKKRQKNLKGLGVLAWILLCRNCTKLIDFIKKIIFSQDFLDRHRKSQNAFTRNRKLPFPTLIAFLVDFATGSCQNELNRFFRVLTPSDLPLKFVTKTAFSKARLKLGYEAFVELNDRLVQYFYKNMPVTRWHGYRLLAIDGSLIRLQRFKSIINHFGVWHNTKGADRPMARASQMFDPLNHVSVDTILSPKSVGERDLALQHFKKLAKGDLVLLDRGYPAYWFLNFIMSMGVDFCCRVTSEKWNVTKRFVESGKREDIISLCTSSSCTDRSEELDLPHNPLTLRLVRVDLDSGEVEVLITSLTDTKALPYDCFPGLYRLRWPVEEDYKKMKSWIQIENFSGKSVESVYQDFYAKVFAKNLTAILAGSTAKDIDATYRNRKRRYQINYTQAYAEMKRILPLFVLRPKDVIAEIISAFRQFLVQSVEAVRPGRKAQRKKEKPRTYHFNYKQIA